jgi:hypothetical protein
MIGWAKPEKSRDKAKRDLLTASTTIGLVVLTVRSRKNLFCIQHNNWLGFGIIMPIVMPMMQRFTSAHEIVLIRYEREFLKIKSLQCIV